jgi:hypothetical protein
MDATQLQLEIPETPPSITEEQGAATPSAAALKQVDEIWGSEQQRRDGRLYDGKIFSVIRRDGAEIAGRFVSYRWWIAQHANPELFDELAVRPLAVSGLLWLPGGMVFGRRAEHTTEQPGMWELVPSGGIDESARDDSGKIVADIGLAAELEEELNVPRSAIREMRPMVIIDDPVSRVCDIAFNIELTLDEPDLLRLFTERKSDEYTELRLVPTADLGSFLEEAGEKIVPGSLATLQVAAMERHDKGE